MTERSQRYSEELDPNEHPLPPKTAGSEARGTQVASQQPWSVPRTGFSQKNDRFQRGGGVERHRQMLTAWQRTQLSEENVRTWERECESEQDGVYREAYFPRGEGWFVVPVATLLGTPALLGPGTTSLERQLPILLGQGPLSIEEPSARPGTRSRGSIGPDRPAVLAAANQESRKGSI